MENLPGDDLADGLVDGFKAFAQAERFEDAGGFLGEADGAAEEGDAEVALHFYFLFCVVLWRGRGWWRREVLGRLNEV